MKSNVEAFIAVDEPSNAFSPVVIACDRPCEETKRRPGNQWESLQIAFAFVVGSAMALIALLL